MSDKYRPKDEKEPLDGSFGENPGYPAQKRPSDWGIGKESVTPPPNGADREQNPDVIGCA